MHNMPYSSHEIIKKAWKLSGLSQEKFAKECGTSQYNLSKYINYKVKQPPEDVIMHCMHKLGMIHDDDISAEELSNSVLDKLSGPSQAALRKAIYQLLQNV